MTTNADITIFNKRYVREERTEKFVATQIRGVSFYSRKGTSSGNQDRNVKDTYTIRVPDTADTSGKAYAEQMNIPAWMMKHFPATGLYSVEISSSVASAIVRRQRRRS